MTTDSYSAEELRALTAAGMALTADLSLDDLLQKLVEVAVVQIDARYGALSVLDSDDRIQKFLTVGISEEERARVGSPPSGHGLLGVLLREGAGLRLDDMAADPRSVGFPPHHPPMKTLLGVPVRARGRIIGNLYLSGKANREPFTDRDEEMVRFLATQAAVAVENADLQEETRLRAESLTRLEERDRIAMDLHDGVIQTVYAVALHLEDIAERLPASAESMRPEVERAMSDLDRVIQEIRGYIFDLRPRVSHVGDLPSALRQLIDNVRVNALINAELEIREPFTAVESDAEALAIFHIAQEALNNVMKHSRADRVRVSLIDSQEIVELKIADDGVGFDRSAESDHKQGFRNMRDRARSVGAEFTCRSKVGEGARIVVRLPREEGL
jgi:signal transduction histidine kinase